MDIPGATEQTLLPTSVSSPDLIQSRSQTTMAARRPVLIQLHSPQPCQPLVMARVFPVMVLTMVQLRLLPQAEHLPTVIHGATEEIHRQSTVLQQEPIQ